MLVEIILEMLIGVIYTELFKTIIQIKIFKSTTLHRLTQEIGIVRSVIFMIFVNIRNNRELIVYPNISKTPIEFP